MESSNAGKSIFSRFRSEILAVLFILLVSISICYPLFQPEHLFASHEGDSYSIRLYEYDAAFQDGFISGRWFRDFSGGIGYPFLSFYHPLFFYLGELVHLLGPGILNSVKIMIFLGLFASGLFTYLLARKLGGSRPAALGAAFLYLYFPYHIVDLYVRGDLSEFTALALIPLCFLTLVNLSRHPSLWLHRVSFSLAYAGIILVHNLIALFVSPMLLAFILFSAFSAERKRLFLLSSLGSFAGGLLISLFYWLPALTELRYVQHEVLTSGFYHFENHFLDFPQLLHGRWGYGSSRSGPEDGLSFEMGIGNILVTIVFLGIWIRSLIRKNSDRFDGYVFLMLTGSIFLTLKISGIFYALLPLMQFIQFPWRMLAFVGFFSSLAILSLDRVIEKNQLKWVITGLLIMLELFCYAKDYRPQWMDRVEVGRYPQYFQDRRLLVTTSGGEYYPKGATAIQPLREGEVTWVRGGPVRVLSAVKKTGSYRFQVDAETPARLVFNCLWFPGWEAAVNGKKQPIGPDSGLYDQNGLVQLEIPPGLSRIDLRLRLTPVREFSLMASAVSLLIFLALLIKNRAARVR